MATCSLFAELLTLLNGASVSTAEGLGAKLHSWVEKRARGPLVLPLLTAACHCLASVRHMARATEACIHSYFADGEWNNAQPKAAGRLSRIYSGKYVLKVLR